MRSLEEAGATCTCCVETQSLRNKSIMFLDQILSPDGLYLLPWSDIKNKLRRHLNIKNFLIWLLIKHVISARSLDVSLIKVKAHSGNMYNDEADLLAKEGTRSGLFLSVNQILPNIPTANLLWTLPDSSKLVLDHNTHSTIKNIQQNYQFSRLIAHSSFAHFKLSVDRKLVDLV